MSTSRAVEARNLLELTDGKIALALSLFLEPSLASVAKRPVFRSPVCPYGRYKLSASRVISMNSVSIKSSRRTQMDNARQLVMLLQTMDRRLSTASSDVGISRESKDFHNAMLRLARLETARRNREERQLKPDSYRSLGISESDTSDGDESEFPLDALSQNFEGCVQQCWMMYRDDVTKHLEMELENLLLSTREECQRLSHRLSNRSST